MFATTIYIPVALHSTTTDTHTHIKAFQSGQISDWKIFQHSGNISTHSADVVLLYRQIKCIYVCREHLYIVHGRRRSVRAESVVVRMNEHYSNNSKHLQIWLRREHN